MKARFRLLKMNSRGGTFYSVDCETGKRASLGTADEYEALQIINAKNESLRQGWLNLQLGRVYLSGTDSGAATRTWQHAMTAIVDSKAPGSENRFRWEKAIKEKAFDLIRNKVILETKAEDLQAVLNAGRVSTNVFLRRIQNYCVGMNWLPWPLLPKKMSAVLGTFAIYWRKPGSLPSQDQKIIEQIRLRIWLRLQSGASARRKPRARRARA